MRRSKQGKMKTELEWLDTTEKKEIRTRRKLIDDSPQAPMKKSKPIDT